MANYNSTANVVLTVNGRQAQQMLNQLQRDAAKLQTKIAAAATAGDKATMKKLQRELNATNKVVNQLRGSAASAAQVLSRLDNATPRELQRTLRTLQSQLNDIQRGSAAWDAHVQKIKLVKAELAKVNASLSTQNTLWKKMNNALNLAQTFIMGAVAALTGLVMAGRKAVMAYADMEEQMANTRKYTRMTVNDVQELNENFKAMDTRISRQELNLLAQEAGRLGKNTLDSVQQYVEASSIIKVALVDLGEGATQTIAKISNIFGMEELYGVKDAMLKVGSTVNVLSQNCTASKPFIVEFTQRMAGIGSQAKMTIPEIMAFAATLDANGQKVEMSASALGRLVMKLYQDPLKIAKEVGLNVNYFTKVLANDTTKGVMMFLEALNKLGDENALAALAPLFKDLGMDGIRMSQVLSNLAAHLDMVKWEMGEANKAFREGTSATKEYNIFNNTVQAGLDKAKNRVHELAISLGEKLLPVMRHIYTSSSTFLRVLNTIIDFIIEHRKAITLLTGTIVAYYVAVGVAKTVQLAWAGAVLLCKNTMVTFKYVIGLCEVAIIALRHGTQAAGTAFTFLNAGMKANPFGLVIAGLTALTIVIMNLIDKTETFQGKIKKAVDRASEWEESTVREQHELDLLIGKLRGAEEGTQTYEDAKASIINQYGKYLEGLVDEKGKILDLEAAYDRLTKAIRRNALAKGLKDAEQEVMDQYLDNVKTKLNELQSTLEDHGISAVKASQITTKVAEAITANKPLDEKTTEELWKASAMPRKTLNGADSWWDKLTANLGSIFSPITKTPNYRQISPSSIVDSMWELNTARDEGLKQVDAMRNGLMPLNKVTNTELEWVINIFKQMIESGKGGNVPTFGANNIIEYKNLSLDKIKKLMEEYQEELAVRGKPAPSPKEYTQNDYPKTGGSGSGSSSSTDKFESEKQWREIREAYAAINKALGYKKNEQGKLQSYSAYDYQREMDNIDIQYYEKILKRTDLTWLERLQMEAKYQEALAKKEEDANEESIKREDRSHESKVMKIKQSYANNLITTEEYNQQIEDEDVRHLGKVKDIYRKIAFAKQDKWTDEHNNAGDSLLRNFSGNVDFTSREAVSAQKLTEAGWQDAKGKKDTDYLFASQVSIKDDAGNNRQVLITPVLPDGSILSPGELDDYVNNVLQGSSDILSDDKKGIVIAIDVNEDGSAKELLQQLQETYYSEKPPMDWDAYTKFVKAQGQYLTLVNSISEKKAKELERASQSHQKDYDKMKDFMLPDDKKDADYKKDMELLKEVYETELELAGDNAERKLQIEEAYRIAKLALNKKYDKQEVSGYKAVMNNIAEWMESDGGKNILGSINVVANGISDIASQVNSLMQANVDALTATIEKRYEKEISAAEGNSYRIAQLEKKKEEEITKMKAEENRKSFAIQVVQAVAQTATNAISAYGAALKIGAAGLVLAPIAAAMATAAGMIQIATIKKQQQAAEAQGYSEGGFTPDGKKNEAVGVVHAGEWVASQRLTKNPKTRPLLEALDYAQRNNTIGSIRMSDVSRSITAPILAASQQQAPTQSTIINNNYATAADNTAISDTLSALNQRLREPFVTVNTVTGDMGIKKAQDEYSKLISNKSPKSRK